MSKSDPVPPLESVPVAPAPLAPPIHKTLLFAVAFLGCFAFADAVIVASRPVVVKVGTPGSPAAPTALVSATIPIPPPPVSAPAPEPAKPAVPEELPPLPETTLNRVPVHTIPEPNIPDRKVSNEVANGPSRSGTLSTPPKQFSGTAQVTGPNALVVGSVPVQLFGIKSPGRDDRCGAPPGENCEAAAQRALSYRLAGKAKISCQTPFPKPGIIVAFSVCLDSQGTDVAGYLVGEGLALADPGQSYDYVGAESVARSQKRGLWAFRFAPSHS